jgi:Ni2+-binding GTPase involved in maturation of urease and hydrogenase
MIQASLAKAQRILTTLTVIILQQSGDSAMHKPLVILVGGFLGAGKTTLLAIATERLTGQGTRVGLITNDQADNLVDTAVLKERDLPVEEVSGGCFCCKFDDLIGAMDKLLDERQPDVLLGEPVGSCTDLSATVMQPLKALHRDRYGLAPFSVLVDPDRVRALLGISPPATSLHVFPENVIYIYRKQLEEADVIVLNKADLLSAEERVEIEDALRRHYPRSHVMSLSAREGTGVGDWLKFVTGDQASGCTVTEVDYDAYADGEAALGWLNAAYKLHADPGSDLEAFCLRVMTVLGRTFRESSAEVAHLKLHLRAGSSSLVANLTSSQGEPSLRGEVYGSPAAARLLINVRAHIDPDALRVFVERGVEEAVSTALRVETEDLRCFAPSRPQPTHRYELVV